MIHPSYKELMDKINEENLAENKAPVTSRYSVVLATSKRARQLTNGAEPLASAKSGKALSIAVEEFYEGKVKHIYFVAETKGSMSSMQLRLIEESKIHCAREHFKAISNGNVVYDVVDSYKSLLEKVMK